MAETSIAVTPGTGATVDGFNSGATSTFRQAVVLADPTTTANVMAVNSNGSIPVQGYQPAVISVGPVTVAGAQTSQSATGYNIATLTLRTFTGTTPSVTFRLEASDDNTNWVVLQGINNATGQVGSSWTQAAALTAGTAGPSIDYTIGAYTNVRVNVTAESGTTPSATFGLAFQTMPYEASPGAVAQGTSANASASLGNPVLVGGWNGTNTYALRTDTSGQLILGAGANAIGKVAATDTYGTTTAMTITLASLASSTVGVGRQSTLITGNTARSALIGVKIGLAGAGETVNSLIYVYLIRGDGTINDDAAGTTDAALTVVNAPLLGTLVVPAATTAAVNGVFDTKALGSLGKTFGIAIVNSSGAALSATAANSAVEYTLIT